MITKNKFPIFIVLILFAFLSIYSTVCRNDLDVPFNRSPQVLLKLYCLTQYLFKYSILTLETRRLCDILENYSSVEDLIFLKNIFNCVSNVILLLKIGIKYQKLSTNSGLDSKDLFLLKLNYTNDCYKLDKGSAVYQWF